jgi:nitrite reductase (NADH) large subunit
MPGPKHVIVGNGVAGVTAAQSITRADPTAEVHVFGAEPYPYYRRPRLWEFLAGEIEQRELYFRGAEWYSDRGIQLHLEARVLAFSPTEHRLTLAGGDSVDYDRLLLATGGRSFVPPFEGVDKRGVFALRSLEDAKAMKTHAADCRSAAVIGGGLLGLETARALVSMGLNVTVIEFVPRLLPRQLDTEGAGVLQTQLEAKGLRILTGAATEAIVGEEGATGVRLKDGQIVDGELVLVSTGVYSRVELAREAGLETNRGVIVDQQLRTSAVDVYAAGDAAEFAGIVYGIIPAAVAQAQIAAANMVAEASATYTGTVPSNILKVVDIDLTSAGIVVPEGDGFVELRRFGPEAGSYRKLVLKNDTLVGAIVIGDKALAMKLNTMATHNAAMSRQEASLMLGRS